MTEPIDKPLSLMRMALALLDKSGEENSLAACHLQAAIDARTGVKPMREYGELDNEQI